jgi:phosphohistidine phosphatase
MQLWLLRHAKSSWSDEGLGDEDRPLAHRGEQAADRVRDYLGAEGIHPELILCSSALRARQTLGRVLPALGGELEVSIEPALYTFDANVLLERLRRIDAAVRSAMVVGHNPAIQDLALRVADRGDELGALSRKYPTAGLGEIVFGEGTWTALADQPGELVRFIVPRDLAGA